jgi:hypothetical protein
MTKMPGKSFTGEPQPLTAAELLMRQQLVDDVEKLAGQIGQRNIWHYQNLAAAADFIESSLDKTCYEVNRQDFRTENENCCNIEALTMGTKYPDQVVVIGAHYDSVFGCPGANDNGSAVAATLALARCFADKKTARSLRFVLFANEEPPFFQTDEMGSLIYAKSCRAKGDNIVAMLCLECIGYYSDEPNSQRYPFPFNLMYPSTGNFIGFVSNFASRKLLHSVVASFRDKCQFPSQAGAVPEAVPGVAWSDQWSFWQQGYPAIMVTDTAPFRYPYYHEPEDTPEKINYDHLTRVISGLEHVIADLAEPTTPGQTMPEKAKETEALPSRSD